MIKERCDQCARFTGGERWPTACDSEGKPFSWAEGGVCHIRYRLEGNGYSWHEGRHVSCADRCHQFVPKDAESVPDVLVRRIGPYK
jgi:hypothetical protein